MRRLTTAEFIEKSKKVHGDKYDYTKSIYVNSRTKVGVLCPVHGLFWILAASHLSGQGCPKCKSSKGESAIKSILKRLNIKFEEQKRFVNCKFKRSLPFDFYLPEYATVIEYQGRQHYDPNCFGRTASMFEKAKRRDQIKANFCLRYGIKLICVPYTVTDIDRFIINKLPHHKL